MIVGPNGWPVSQYAAVTRIVLYTRIRTCVYTATLIVRLFITRTQCRRLNQTNKIIQLIPKPIMRAENHEKLYNSIDFFFIRIMQHYKSEKTVLKSIVQCSFSAEIATASNFFFGLREENLLKQYYCRFLITQICINKLYPTARKNTIPRVSLKKDTFLSDWYFCTRR